MKEWFLITCCFLLMASAHSETETNLPLTINKIFKNGRQFVFTRDGDEPPLHGITIMDPFTREVLYEVNVSKCGPSKCLGVIQKNFTNKPLTLEGPYIHSYNEPGNQTKLKGKKLKPSLTRQAYLGYGSPLGPGLSLGYFSKLEGALKWGVRYSNVSGKTSNVGIKGHLLTGGLLLPLMDFSKSFKLNLLGEIGILKSSLDFGGVNALGPTIDETTFLAAVASEGTYRINKKFTAGVRLGFSKNGLKSSYARPNGSYENPYSKLILFLEAGVYFAF